MTRRLVDASQDVVVTIEDCGTLRGLETTALKKNDEVVEPLADRIVGRVSLHDVYDPRTEELLVASGQMISEDIAASIDAAPIESVEIRSALTCEAKKGVCAKCYGRNYQLETWLFLEMLLGWLPPSLLENRVHS